MAQDRAQAPQELTSAPTRMEMASAPRNRLPHSAATDTIAAIATPPGAGALGVLRLSGLNASRVALALLPRVEHLIPRRAVFARAHAGGAAVDQVVATYFPGPTSATGEDLVELSAHGSPYILKKLLEAALEAGARLAAPGEFTQRAFLNGRLDLAQADAVCDLIRARTETAHAAALRQLEGGLSRSVSGLREPILELAIRVEANLDHPEEDIPSITEREASAHLEGLASPIRELAATFERGRLVAEGARICIVGRPNAGKSSLLNALLGAERAIVCPTPGTTRDTLEEAASVAGIPSVLVDTAGLREESSDPAELMGMERAERALQGSDLALLVIDRSRPVAEEDRRVHERILALAAKTGRPVISVFNKADLAARAEDCPADLSVSASAKTGLEELARLIAARLASAPGEAEPVLVTSLRHREALLKAAGELEEARQAVSRLPKAWEDRVACHLRQALRSLGEITGESAPDEVLHGVFSRFCVGK